MLGDAEALLSFSPNPGGFSQPHTGSQIPHKGERAAELAAGEEEIHLSHGLSPFCVAPEPDGLLVSNLPQSFLCLFLVPPRLPQFFAELIDSPTCG